jgi:L-iditol 2-dehydrogenase
MIDQQKMFAARLYGKEDIRIVKISKPPIPKEGQALIRVKAVGICGSDLNLYQQVSQTKPVILGHEFSGLVEDIGKNCFDGFDQPLQRGIRVAVDPNQSCGRCEMCQKGHPNLCLNLHFAGFYPDNGALQEWITVPGRCCFPVSETVDYESAALLEPLGVAIHAIDLAKVKPGHTAAVLGAGPIGLCILQVLRSMNVYPIFMVDQFGWRLKIAKEFGGIPVNFTEIDPTRFILNSTGNRGTDVVFEAAWADSAAQLAADIAATGSKLVMIGIPKDDKLSFNHSTLRRKGLTVLLVRRMKHTYPRAIKMLERGVVNLKKMITHRFPLEKTAEAFALNAGYNDQVIKVIIQV